MGCRAHLCQLPGLGQLGHSPRGTSGIAGTLDWAQCGQAPSSPTINDVLNLMSDRLTFLYMAGWLANCGWLADWLSNKMSTQAQAETSCGQVWYYFIFGSGWPWSDVPPHQRHLVAKCDTTAPLGQVDLWSDEPLTRDILWPSVTLL